MNFRVHALLKQFFCLCHLLGTGLDKNIICHFFLDFDTILGPDLNATD